MIIFSDGVVREIADERVATIDDFDLRKDIRSTKSVYIDGLLYTHALAVYIEHKQYLTFQENVSPQMITELFSNIGNIIFYDIGTLDASDGKSEFKDYSAKAKEGISYFEDVITPEDRNCTYKENYIEVRVRL